MMLGNLMNTPEHRRDSGPATVAAAHAALGDALRQAEAAAARAEKAAADGGDACVHFCIRAREVLEALLDAGGYDELRVKGRDGQWHRVDRSMGQ